MNTAIKTVVNTATNSNETAAHVAAAKAKLALAAAKQAAKDAEAAVIAEKQAVRKAKKDAAEAAEKAQAESTEKRFALIENVKADIAAIDADHIAFVVLAETEHAEKVAALLATHGLTVDDISGKRAKRDATPSLELPTAWVKGATIDAHGFIVDADAESAIYTIGQQGKRPTAFYAARESAMARQNASAE